MLAEETINDKRFFLAEKRSTKNFWAEKLNNKIVEIFHR